jgi:hypothetical protein
MSPPTIFMAWRADTNRAGPETTPRARTTGQRRKATRRRRAQPWASTRAGEELHGGATSIPNSGCLARPPLQISMLHSASETGRGKGRERKGCWTCSGGAFPHRRTAMEAAAVMLCSAVKKEKGREKE